MKVAIIGAGYAGTFAANRLNRKLEHAQITVINPRPDFVERVRLHQQVAGTAQTATPLTSMLRDGITTRVGTVDKIGDGNMTLDDGGNVDFDYLFLAAGSTVLPMPGTLPIGTWDGAEQSRAALAALPDGGTVTVVGGGPTGIETAAEVAEARPGIRVRIIGTQVADSFSHTARRRVRAGLQRLNIDVVDDSVVDVATGTGQFDRMVHTASGRAFATDLTLWAIVAGVPDLAARSGLEVDPRGRAVVDGYLRSVSDPRIFVVGDCAAVPGARFACQSAGPQAASAADTLARTVTGGKPKPYVLRYVARAVTLGRSNAVGQFTRLDDTLLPAYVTGRTAAALKEVASRGAKFGSRTGFGA
jgi:NADH dehydrogenase FAD-containing subunit